MNDTYPINNVPEDDDEQPKPDDAGDMFHWTAKEFGIRGEPFLGTVPTGQPQHIREQIADNSRKPPLPSMPKAGAIEVFIQGTGFKVHNITWAERLNKIRELAFSAPQLAVLDSTKALLANFNVEDVVMVLPEVEEVTAQDHVLINMRGSTRYAATITLVFGPRRNDRIRWLVLDFGDSSEASTQAFMFVQQVQKVSVYGELDAK